MIQMPHANIHIYVYIIHSNITHWNIKHHKTKHLNQQSEQGETEEEPAGDFSAHIYLQRPTAAGKLAKRSQCSGRQVLLNHLLHL